MTDARPLLTIEDMRIHYDSVRGAYKVVDGVDIEVHRNEIFGLAGESGCGKSTLVEGILRLIEPPGHIRSGTALFRPFPEDPERSLDLVQLDYHEMREIRWKHLSYIPQGSMNSLNPVMRIRDQMMDVVMHHEPGGQNEINRNIAAALEMVGLPESLGTLYPHELSGGMKQRVCIAMSMLLQPALVVADEPTTALDVNVQRAVLETIAHLRDQMGAAVIFVSHDLAVHAELVDRMAIMYAGVVMELGTVYEIFDNPQHPYTKRLIHSIPALGGPRERLESIPGMAPSPLAWPEGCRFHPRCPDAVPACSSTTPRTIELDSGRKVACHLFDSDIDLEHGSA